MSDADRKFIPEAEKIWQQDYQCDYFRGVIIDEKDNIVERCPKLHPDYEHAVRDAERRIATSPLYAKQTTPEMRQKLEEFKKQKKQRDMRERVTIFNPQERNGWQYLYDRGLYRFRYLGQGAADAAFYLERVEEESDIEKLPGHKDIWKIVKVLSIRQDLCRNSRVKIRYVVYGNLREDFCRREKTKTITIRRGWPFYEELMETVRFFQKHYDMTQ